MYQVLASVLFFAVGLFLFWFLTDEPPETFVLRARADKATDASGDPDVESLTIVDGVNAVKYPHEYFMIDTKFYKSNGSELLEVEPPFTRGFLFVQSGQQHKDAFVFYDQGFSTRVNVTSAESLLSVVYHNEALDRVVKIDDDVQIATGKYLLATDIVAEETVQAGELTDGTATLTEGVLSGATSVSATTLTDGTATLTGGVLSGATSVSATTLTDGTATLSGGVLSGLGALASSSVSDGTATLTGGNLTSVTTLAVGTNAAPHSGIGQAVVAIEGTASLQCTNDAVTDAYPLFSLYNNNHDDINMAFDAYVDTGLWKASDTSSFLWQKNSDKLQLKSGTAAGAGSNVTWTDAVTVDTSGNVGIGTTSPDRKLHIFNGSAGTVTGTASAPLVVENSGNSYVQTLAPDGNISGVVFGHGSDNFYAYMLSYGPMNASAGNLHIGNAGNTNMVIDGSGNVGMGIDTPDTNLHVLKATAAGTHTDDYAVAILEDADARLQIKSNNLGSHGSALVCSTGDRNWTFHSTGVNSGHRLDIGYRDSATNGNIAGDASAYLCINTSGHVGVGTTSPTLAKLVVQDSGSLSSRIADVNNNEAFMAITDGTTSMVFDSNEIHVVASGTGSTLYIQSLDVAGDTVINSASGNVGIGNVTPDKKLHVEFTDNSTPSNNENINGIMVRNLGTAGGAALNLVCNGSANPDWVAVAARWMSTNNTAMDFWTEGAAGRTVKMTIENDGNVGIGTTTPDDCKLHIQDGSAGSVTANSSTRLAVESSGHTIVSLLAPNDEESSIVFGFPASSIHGSIVYDGPSAERPSTMQFRTGGNVDRMVIDGSGQVGIGTLSPDNTLHVHKGSAGSVTANEYAPLVVENSHNTYIQTLALDDRLSGFLLGHASNNAYASILSYGPSTGNPGALHFANGGGNTNMVIDGSGYVGFGTTSPAKQLEVRFSDSGTDSDYWNESGLLVTNESAALSSLMLQVNKAVNGDLAGVTCRSLGTNNTALDLWTELSGVRSTKLTVNNNGYVGIGTMSPDNVLHVWKGDAGAVTTNANAVLVVENNSSSYINVIAPNNEASGILFGNPTSNINGGFTYHGPTDSPASTMKFWTNTTTQMVLNGSGYLGIGTDSPDAELHVVRASAGSVSTGSKTVITAENSDNVYLGTLTPNDHYGGVLFGCPADEAHGGILYGGPTHSTAPSMMLFRTGGNTTRMVLDGSGQVGIGTTAPDNLLHIQNASAGTVTAFSTALAVVENSANCYFSTLSPDNYYGGIMFGCPTHNYHGGISYGGPTSTAPSTLRFHTNQWNTQMVIDGSGQVGIGTTSPEGLLHVYDGNSGGSTFAGSSLVVENDAACLINLLAPDNQPQGFLFGCPTASDHGGILYYGPTDSPASTMQFRTGGNNTRMIINGSGYVGIGTTSPDNVLHVHKGSAGTVSGTSIAPLVVESSSHSYLNLLAPNAYSTGIFFGCPTHNEYAGIVHYGPTDSPADQMRFRTGNNVDRMTILGSGQVGIGTTAPDNVLHVWKGDAGAVTTNANAVLVVENSSSSYINVIAPNNEASGILFGNPTSNINGGFTYHGPTDSPASTMKFWTNTTTQMVINGSGQVGIGTDSPDTQKVHIHGSSNLLRLTSSAGSGITQINHSGNDMFFNHFNGHMYLTQASAYNMYLRTSNTNRMTITSGGNVGIGTTSPDNTLHVHKGSAGTVTANGSAPLVVENSGSCYINLLAPPNVPQGILFGNSTSVTHGGIHYYGPTDSPASQMQFRTNGGTTQMVIDSAGQVGIGTTTPDNLLHVYSGSAGTVTAHAKSYLVVESSDTSYISTLTPDSNYGGLLFGCPAHNYHGAITYGGPTSGQPSTMVFSTNEYTSAMAIDGSGRVGIGTITPDQTLHVHKGSAGSVTGNSNAPLVVENSTHCYLQVLAPDGSDKALLFGSPASIAHGGIIYSGTTMQFRTNLNVTRMVLDGSGNVGINDSTPSYKLDVNGTLRATGNMYGNAYLVLDDSAAHGVQLDLNGVNEGHLGVAASGGQFSDEAGPGDVILRAFNNDLFLTTMNGGRIIFTTGAGTDDTTKMRINNDGQVGINVDPSYQLDVSGDIHTDSKLVVDPAALSGTTTGSIMLDSGNSNVITVYDGTGWVPYMKCPVGNLHDTSTLQTDLNPAVWCVAGETTDRAGGVTITEVNTMATLTKFGRTCWVFGQTGYLSLATTINATTQNWTVVVAVERLSTADNTVLFIQPAPGDTNHYLYNTSSYWQVDEYDPSGDDAKLTNYQDRAIYAFVHSDNGGGEVSLYINGELLQTEDHSGDVYSGTTPTTMVVGARTGTSTYSPGMQIYGFAVWESTLSAANVAAITWEQLLNDE